jgi:hypothetical protein
VPSFKSNATFSPTPVLATIGGDAVNAMVIAGQFASEIASCLSVILPAAASSRARQAQLKYGDLPVAGERASRGVSSIFTGNAPAK